MTGSSARCAWGMRDIVSTFQSMSTRPDQAHGMLYTSFCDEPDILAISVAAYATQYHDFVQAIRTGDHATIGLGTVVGIGMEAGDRFRSAPSALCHSSRD